MHVLRSVTVGALLLAGLAVPAPTSAQAPDVDAAARLLGGLPQRGPTALSALEETAVWHEHRTRFSALWSRWEETRARPMRRWAARELADARPPEGTVFYPFSGPDIQSALAFFPDASEYVLIGLEPVGSLPNVRGLEGEALAALLDTARQASRDLLQISFFRTNEMAVDMQEIGVLPILLLSLARTGHEVTAVRMTGLLPSGRVAPRSEATSVPGVTVRFRKPGGRPQTVHYFAADLSDGGIGGSPGMQAFLSSLNSPTTYVKAATYLMHKPYFSRVRTAILERSAAVLQDDSGIPYRYFSTPGSPWEVRLYGAYSAPIPLFAEWMQPDLWEAFNRGAGARPLDFGIGYHHRPGTSNLIYARRIPRGVDGAHADGEESGPRE